jgi:hypothetical protein
VFDFASFPKIEKIESFLYSRAEEARAPIWNPQKIGKLLPQISDNHLRDLTTQKDYGGEQ